MAIIRWSSVASAFSDALKLSKLSMSSSEDLQNNSVFLLKAAQSSQDDLRLRQATAGERYRFTHNMTKCSQRRLLPILPQSFVNRRVKCDVRRRLSITFCFEIKTVPKTVHVDKIWFCLAHLERACGYAFQVDTTLITWIYFFITKCANLIYLKPNSHSSVT